MIKRIAITTILLALVGAIASCPQQERSQNSGDNLGGLPSKYYCGKSKDGTPTTFAQSDRGDLPIVRWESDYFQQFGWSREQRCSAISDKFQQAYEQRILNYITTGTVNNQAVICASSGLGDNCQFPLFTLSPNRNPTQALEEIFGSNSVGGGATIQRRNEGLYVEFEDFINRRNSQ